MTGKRILSAAGVLLFAIMVAVAQYRGPTPLAEDAPADRPSAARMRETLVDLLGDPPQTHRTGTPESDAFLLRLEKRIDSYGVSTKRIELPWPVETDPPDLKLKNLLATIPGRDAGLPPILFATHHDSCSWGPGAGDAGSAVVALLENIRISAKQKPLRTMYFLFTDGEESGLLGAHAIAAMESLPFDEPAFVLNFDARGTRGGVPMFETHPGNEAWVRFLIRNLASPKITSSLAVTVYRMLPNATDFDVWNSTLRWPGFNYATIGGAEHYHQPSDRPENLSDRTLQHMGDHIFAMQKALDVETLPKQDADQRNGVFFDICGFAVICYRQRTQQIVGLAALCLIAYCMIRTFVVSRDRSAVGPLQQVTTVIRHAVAVSTAIVLGIAIGFGAEMLLRQTPFAGLAYTPFDQGIGLVTMMVSFLAATAFLEMSCRPLIGPRGQLLCDWTWLVVAMAGAGLSFGLPGGAYLLVMPAAAFALTRIVTRSPIAASWAGWIVTAFLVGPMLTLLVQALGPWMQPLYGAAASLLAIKAMTVWVADTQGWEGSTRSPV